MLETGFVKTDIKMTSLMPVFNFPSNRFDVSVTSTLIETVRKTFATWHQDYTDSSDPKMLRITRKRQPLVPYLLRNLTGTPLYFITQTAALRDINVLTNGVVFDHQKCRL